MASSVSEGFTATSSLNCIAAASYCSTSAASDLCWLHFAPGPLLQNREGEQCASAFEELPYRKPHTWHCLGCRRTIRCPDLTNVVWA